MKKIRIYIAVGTVCLLFSSAKCFTEVEEYKIAVYNEANHNIDVLLSYGDPIYPDTLLPNRNYDKLMSVKPGSARYYGNTLTYKKFIQQYNSDTIILFIFYTDTLSKYSWDEVREGYKILKRYDISWQEMEALKGDIHYPPTDAEKGIRQYPPFGKD